MLLQVNMAAHLWEISQETRVEALLALWGRITKIQPL